MALNMFHFSTSLSSELFVCLLTFMLIACAISSSMRFYIKLSLVGIQFAVFCTLTVLVSLLSPGEARNLNRACKYLLWITRIWGIQFNIKGRDNMKEDSNYIVVCNHQSTFDTVAMLHVLPENTRVMMKKEITYTPFIGMVAWAHGAIFVDRHNHQNAMNVLSTAANQIRQEKCSVWVYVEGTRHHGDTLLPFKKGAFHLAQQSKVAILPMVFSNYSSIVNFKERRFLKGIIDITILPAVSTEDLGPSDVNDLTNNVREIMCNEYEQNNNRTSSKL